MKRTGTGKTHTLVELIRQICKLDDKARVLVCGASNLAADNVLERLLARAPELSATRIGHPARVLANSRVLDSTLDARAERSEQVCGLKWMYSQTQIKPCWIKGGIGKRRETGTR